MKERTFTQKVGGQSLRYADGFILLADQEEFLNILIVKSKIYKLFLECPPTCIITCNNNTIQQENQLKCFGFALASDGRYVVKEVPCQFPWWNP